MLSELFLIETGDLRIEPDCLLILLILALELLMDGLPLLLLLLILLHRLCRLALHVFQLDNVFDGLLTLQVQQVRKKDLLVA
jgi:hypothetical protein